MLKAVNIIGTWKFQALWFVATIALLTTLEWNWPGSAFLYAMPAGVIEHYNLDKAYTKAR